jgi:hypothetical protein
LRESKLHDYDTHALEEPSKGGIDGSYKGAGKSLNKCKTIFGKPQKKEAGDFDGWEEDEISNGSFVKNTELELLRINQKILKLENSIKHEID